VISHINLDLDPDFQ
jgi:sorbose reductase